MAGLTLAQLYEKAGLKDAYEALDEDFKKAVDLFTSKSVNTLMAAGAGEGAGGSPEAGKKEDKKDKKEKPSYPKETFDLSTKDGCMAFYSDLVDKAWMLFNFRIKDKSGLDYTSAQLMQLNPEYGLLREEFDASLDTYRKSDVFTKKVMTQKSMGKRVKEKAKEYLSSISKWMSEDLNQTAMADAL